MNTQLCTKRNKNDYERIVDICVHKDTNTIPYINNSETFKLVLLKKGSLYYNDFQNKKSHVKSPAVILVSNDENLELLSDSSFQATTIYFKPTVINDAFQYQSLLSDEFEQKYGTTLYQDYLLIRNFIHKESTGLNALELTSDMLTKLLEMILKMESELTNQYDGYWPCRSRSYLIEILFFINFCYESSQTNKVVALSEVISYLNNHIADKISLETLTKEFNINRNVLNQLFINETGMTCLSYLLKMRLDLACLLLSETELPISEISLRLGYLDQNYFTKVFRKELGTTPSEYRLNPCLSNAHS